MNRDQLKIELLQKIIACNDEKLLAEVDNILKSFPSEVKENPQPYSKEADVSFLSEKQKETLEKRYELYLSQESETKEWTDVKAEIIKRHGF
ncbi:hypothetical protein RM545_02515 [Zunongwangia sp. F260]|uniref:Addiction module component n=1 Tax=Autumnicola lenta TaxID=3075593 RepID=A0ABU3CH33_9FLAO|nr:hypothetical protein [Zunongwangia sp. F260]MDT0645552.1 hypothetical protein [Zunongwangia sp. F260]